LSFPDDRTNNTRRVRPNLASQALRVRIMKMNVGLRGEFRLVNMINIARFKRFMASRYRRIIKKWDEDKEIARIGEISEIGKMVG
jgi:hypothetical protein